MIAGSGFSAFLPKLIEIGDSFAPAAPVNVAATGIDRNILIDLALKTAYVLPQFTAEDIATRMHLPQMAVAELLDQLQSEQLLEVLGHTDNKGYRYLISQRGKDRAQRAFEISGYIGPAPVSLDAYTAMIEWFSDQPKHIDMKQVTAAFGELVLDKDAIEIAGMAVSSGRSLFLSGPPGNGKTSIGRSLHNVTKGYIWIPCCLAVEHNIIRLFDTHCHEAVPLDAEKSKAVDHRWVRIKPPFVVAGGEMTLESLDMAYLPSLRYYEAPLHMKANGGTFLIDDFGRQHVEPAALLNRWIIPLEHRIDFLTLYGGQKIQIPFRLMLIIATNLRPEEVTDPAFLRRIGYRLHIERPSEETYAKIFSSYAKKYNLEPDPAFIKRLLERYKKAGRELRACEPRDLIERINDICKYHRQPMTLSDEFLNLAWKAYFSDDAKVAA